MVPEIKEARKRIASCRERGGDVLNLEGLRLDDSTLSSLLQPQAIGGLAVLKSLSLANNQLAALPEAICGLTALESLLLEYNRLTALAEGIGRLTKLHTLTLNNNQLAALPEDIGGLTNLHTLYLNNNQLTALPEAIGRLTKLETLSLDNNRLTALPEGIGRLAKLETLSLDNNQLVALPDDISRFAALQILSLDDNQLTVLPEAIGGLAKLQRLTLGNNRLTALPEAIGGLSALQILSLDDNQLEALPKAIGCLVKLRGLSLNNNRLASLPEAVGGLALLQALPLDGNPLDSPPEEIVSQGTEATLRFLAGVLADGKPLHEAKLVLVGDPAHGKTALRSWFEHGAFREPPESTRGGELVCRKIDVNGEEGRINIWDFGGQDRYRPAQQPLFTPGAFYLLICNGRKNIVESGVEEWLRLIQLRAGRDARVLLIFTHTKEHDGVPSLAPLRDDLRQMIKDSDIFTLDSPTGCGVQRLLDYIDNEARALPRFHHKWPGSYIAARNKVLSLRGGGKRQKSQSYIPYSRFLDICEPYGVEGACARSLAVAMSLQGRIDYKGTEGDPDQLVVLDPEWLLKAIAYVADDREIKENGGILHRRELRRIWYDHGRLEAERPVRYEEHLWPRLLELMARHDLVYRLSEEEWVVPQSVPEAPPPSLPWSADGVPIRLDCRLDYPISGLMAFLIVRNNYKHVKGKRLFWQRGAFLRHPVTGAEALITVDGEQIISMETRGPQNEVLIHDLQETLVRLIYDRWPGSQQEEDPPFTFTVPCPAPGCRGKYALTVLQAERAAGREDSFCDARRPHANPVAKLLYGIELPTAVAAIRWSTLANQTRGEPPRLLEVSEPPEPNAGKRLTKDRVRIQLYCELSEKLVPGAAATIEVLKDWAEEFGKWGPWVGGHLKTLWSTPDADFDISGLPKHEDRKASQKHLLGLPKGRVMRPEGQILPGPLADKLIEIANKGEMRQTQRSDGRWVWASKEEADRNDPTIPKER